MQKKQSKIKYFDVYGLRKEKYDFLESHDVTNTKWQELELKKPYYFFVPKDFRLEEIYNKFLSLTKTFGFYNVGGKPGDDKFLVDKDRNSLIGKVSGTAETLKTNQEEADTEAKRNLLNILKDFCFDEEKIIEYNYRPFDVRYSYYDKRIYTRPVSKLKKQLDSKNICIVTTKILKSEPFAHIFVSTIFPDVIFLSNKTSTNTFVFPLYIYEKHSLKGALSGQKRLISVGQMQLDEQDRDKKSNIKLEIIKKLSDSYKGRVSPEEIFYYIYGILYSNTYRKKYQEFLKIDFPRIPFVNDNKLFLKVAEIGKELVDLHLLKSEKLENPGVVFPIVGDNTIKKREYGKKLGRLYINDVQYFGTVVSDVWNYRIGGYQVLDKWLKDRIGKTLSSEDVNHYLKVVTAITYTIDLQKQIDKIYPEVEKNLI